MAAVFTPRTVRFLRTLARNNDREWFKAHKAEYEQDVQAPMVAVVARLADDFAGFAPELVADPRVSLFRIYRDTRFSEDKSPLKTHIGAHFPTRGFPKGEGAGLYFEVAPTGIWIGGGLYRPPTAALVRLREAIALNPKKLQKIVTAPAFKDAVGALDGERLKGVPRGYPADHPAADLLKFKQFIAGTEREAAYASDPGFYPDLLKVFRAVLPLVRYLNAALAPLK